MTLEEAIRQGRVEVTIDGLGYQAEGFVRLEDGWLSVRGTLPGERVIADVAPGRGRRIWGTLREVVAPARERRDAHCTAFPGCRGCHVRHVSVTWELAHKSATVAECIEKYGGLPTAEQPEVETVSVIGAARADAFRVRTNLTVRSDGAAWDVGLQAADGIVQMASCPALAPSTRRAVERFEGALAGMDPAMTPPDLVRIAAVLPGHGYVDLQVQRDEGYEPLLEALDATFPEQFGIAIVDRERKRRHVRGPRRIRLPMADLRLEVGFDDWFHATLEPAEALYDAVLAWLEPARGERVLDAGCGIGTIGLLCAAAGADVVGFDINRASIETAELNAMSNGLDVRFVCGGWERVFRDLVLAGARFDTLVINPMRDPLGERALAYVPRLGAKRVLYLGPSAVPAAKDVATLRARGYTVDRLAAVNLHPATYHVMLGALLRG